jgi:hypothetical protein
MTTLLIRLTVKVEAPDPINQRDAWVASKAASKEFDGIIDTATTALRVSIDRLGERLPGFTFSAHPEMEVDPQ